VGAALVSAVVAFTLLGCGGTSSSPQDGGPRDAERSDSRPSANDATTADAATTLDAADIPDSGVLTISVMEFSGVQGANDWYYGYVAPATSPDFVPMTNFRVDPTYGAIWSVDPDLYWTQLRDVDAHGNGVTTTGAGHIAVEHWTVRRWVSRYSANIDISVRFAKVNDDPSGNGVEGRIIVDGSTVWTHRLSVADTTGITTNVSATVHPGSTVDFVLDPYLSDDVADLSTFTATIRAL